MNVTHIGVERVLPADVYDALELSALVHGGFTADWYGCEEERDKLVGGELDRLVGCPHAHAFFLHGDFGGEVSVALQKVGLSALCPAIMSIVGRISFAEFCERVNLKRGE